MVMMRNGLWLVMVYKRPLLRLHVNNRCNGRGLINVRDVVVNFTCKNLLESSQCGDVTSITPLRCATGSCATFFLLFQPFQAVLITNGYCLIVLNVVVFFDIT